MTRFHCTLFVSVRERTECANRQKKTSGTKSKQIWPCHAQQGARSFEMTWTCIVLAMLKIPMSIGIGTMTRDQLCQNKKQIVIDKLLLTLRRILPHRCPQQQQCWCPWTEPIKGAGKVTAIYAIICRGQMTGGGLFKYCHFNKPSMTFLWIDF